MANDNHKANQGNKNTGTSGNNITNSKVHGNRGAQLNPNSKVHGNRGAQLNPNSKGNKSSVKGK